MLPAAAMRASRAGAKESCSLCGRCAHRFASSISIASFLMQPWSNAGVQLSVPLTLQSSSQKQFAGLCTVVRSWVCLHVLMASHICSALACNACVHCVTMQNLLHGP